MTAQRKAESAEVRRAGGMNAILKRMRAYQAQREVRLELECQELVRNRRAKPLKDGRR